MERIFRFCDAAVQGMVAYMCPAAVGTGSWRARFGRSSVRFGAPLMAFGLLLGLILVGCAPSSSGGASGNGANMPMDAACQDNLAVSVAAGDCDGDGVNNGMDAFQRNACATTDTDGDQFPDSVATPEAGQPCDDAAAALLVTALNSADMAMATSLGCTAQAFAQCADTDDDNDMTNDDSDAFPLNACATMNSDDDGHPDTINAVGTPAACTAEMRAALVSEMVGGIPLQMDNCRDTNNPNQLNSDSDALGDACDPDRDDDNVLDNDAPGIVVGTSMFNSMTVTATTPRDEFPLDASRSCAITTTNRTSTMLNCDNDVDSSGATIPNNADNCPAIANPLQTNSDNPGGMTVGGDGFGDACDVDDDNDGLIEIYDSAMLNNVRHTRDGSGYRTAAGSMLDTTGAPSTNPAACTNFTANTTNLCGYELAGDIDFPSGWVPIPIVNSTTGSFSGIFEGNGYILGGLNHATSSTSTIGGLFDRLLGEQVTVRNLRVTGTLSASGTPAAAQALGGIVGSMTARIVAVSSGVAVSSNEAWTVGGLAGSITTIGSGTQIIRNSFADGAVSSSSTTGVGGLIGQIFGSAIMISNSYATGAVSGTAGAQSVGGLGGANGSGAVVSNSLATGMVNGMAGADTVGGLIGRLSIGSIAPTASYYPDNTIVDDPDATSSDAIDTITTDGSAQTLAALQGCGAAGARLSDADATLACTGIYTGWAAADWDFGTASQLPALKFTEHANTITPDSDCTPTTDTGSTFDDLPLRPGALAQPYCGKLLPCQRVSSTDTAEMTRCGL